jgi:hypothetical protein
MRTRDMPKVNQILEGLQILASYSSNGGRGDDAEVEAGVLYSGPQIETDTMLNEEREYMEALGWIYFDKYECWGIFV